MLPCNVVRLHQLIERMHLRVNVNVNHKGTAEDHDEFLVNITNDQHVRDKSKSKEKIVKEFQLPAELLDISSANLNFVHLTDTVAKDEHEESNEHIHVKHEEEQGKESNSRAAATVTLNGIKCANIFHNNQVLESQLKAAQSAGSITLVQTAGVRQMKYTKNRYQIALAKR